VLIIPRLAWEPRHRAGLATSAKKIRVVIHHAPERPIPINPTRKQIAEQLRIIEDWHAKNLTPTNPRIGYEFAAIEQTGEIWECLGWGRIGAHVRNHNTLSMGIVLLGIDGRKESGSDKVWRSISSLVREGISKGFLVPNVAITVHNDFVATTCPGGVLARMVRGLTLQQLLALSAGTVEAPPKVVWSNFFNEWLYISRYKDDTDWSFVKSSDMKWLPQHRGFTRLSEMPSGEPGQ
jgi:hypothetical protein